MEKITDNKVIQQIELEILEKIHNFCVEHGLRYALCGGTLIGAIRHKGFIPWDDDVDIFMPRPDYEIFCREFHADGVTLHNHRNDKYYAYPFAKIYDDRTLLIEHSLSDVEAGVYVDIFPIDGFPENPKTIHRFWRSRAWILHWLGYKHTLLFKRGRALYKQIALLIFRSFLWAFPNRFFIEIFTRVISSCDYEKSPCRGCLTWGYGVKEVLPAEAFARFDVPVTFAGKTFFTISGWHEYLTALYGDYMKLPPPEKRVSNHDFTAWWKDGYEK